MSEEHPHPPTTSRSWREKLSQALTREPRDRHELLEMLRDAAHRHLLDLHSLDMIEGVLEVSSLRVRDIMIPRSQMIMIEQEATLIDILPIVIETVHSRFPIIGDNKDAVLGILLAKDLLPYAFSRTQKIFHIKDVLRPAIFIPESKRLDALLQEFRRNRNHMAMVVDEYGGITGLVTIEDVLEQIVGNIEDEYDTEDTPFIKKYQNHSYAVKALTPVETFNAFFNTDLEETEVDTIGGLVMREFGRLPKRGESLEIGAYSFTVLRADNRRVYLFQVVEQEKIS